MIYLVGMPEIARAMTNCWTGGKLASDATSCHKTAIEGRWHTCMRFFAGPRLLVVDELGYLPLPGDGSRPCPLDLWVGCGRSFRCTIAMI